MAEGFVEGDGGGVGEVEASGFGASGDAEEAVGGLGGEPVVGKAAGFGAEDEGVSGGEGCVGVESGGACGEGPEAVGADGGGGFVEGVDHAEAEVWPVVEAGASAAGVVQAEAEGTDEPESGAGGDAGAADGAGVGGDFGLDQDDVEAREVVGRRDVACGHRFPYQTVA